MPDIRLEPNTWTNIYAETGIDVGTQLNVQSAAGCVVYLKTSTTQPNDIQGSVRMKPFMMATNKASSTGEWAYALSPAIISVSEA